jgi:hypothetical protein
MTAHLPPTGRVPPWGLVELRLPQRRGLVAKGKKNIDHARKKPPSPPAALEALVPFRTTFFHG